MTTDELIKIFEKDGISKWEGDNAMQGLLIITKYLPNSVIKGADHDVIYSVDIDVLIEAGITTEDAKKLKALNWMIRDEEYLACFV